MNSNYCSPLWLLQSYGSHKLFFEIKNTNAEDKRKNSKEIAELTMRFKESNKYHNKYLKLSHGRKLTLSRSKRFKCFSSSVKLAKLSGGSERCGAMTRRNLKKGDYVFMSRPFAAVVEPNESYIFKYCYTCHRTTSKGEYIRCDHCWMAYFCRFVSNRCLMRTFDLAFDSNNVRILIYKFYQILL